MAQNRFVLFTVLLSGVGTLLAGCQGSPTTQAAPPLAEAPPVAPPKTVAADQAAPSAATGRAVPFVGRPGVGAVVRAAEANATTH